MQTLSVYVHTAAKGWWHKQVTVTGGGSGAVGPSPVAAGHLRSPFSIPSRARTCRRRGSSFAITGMPPTQPRTRWHRCGEIWIFGERNSSSGRLLGTTTVQSDGSWSLTFVPTRFTSTHTNIYVYAHSRATVETQVSADSISSASWSGWLSSGLRDVSHRQRWCDAPAAVAEATLARTAK